MDLQDNLIIHPLLSGNRHIDHHLMMVSTMLLLLILPLHRVVDTEILTIHLLHQGTAMEDLLPLQGG